MLQCVSKGKSKYFLNEMKKDRSREIREVVNVKNITQMPVHLQFIAVNASITF